MLDGDWSSDVCSSDLFVAGGCEDCGHTGVEGRTAIFEVLVVGDEVREALKGAPSTQQLAAVAIEQGLVPLKQAALKAAHAGEISLAEALRVAD
jgi:type II secretory ATPase GspE/PulE/Tfp pilus assembly ATPase PilB-like protein